MAKTKHRGKKRKKIKSPPWVQKPSVKNLGSTEIPRPRTNTRIELTRVLEFAADHPEAKIPRSPRGGPSVYKVTFILAIPGKSVYRDELNIQQIMTSGESLLALPVGVHLKAQMWNESESVEILFMSNKRGLLSTAQLRLSAATFEAAEQVGYDLVMPQLSYWSYLFDVAIDMADMRLLKRKPPVQSMFLESSDR